ncbi:MAG: ABC transporter permease [Alphaproteobacteria bacterium]|nr:ABC transporter permease [Alphaproteobacteria bacterium]
MSAAGLAVFLGAWELAVRALDVPAVVLPPPSSVLTSLVSIIRSGAVFWHLGVTLTEILAGFAVGASAAFVLGALIAQFRIVDRLLYPYIVAFQAVPKVAIAPLLVIWFGFGLESKILMTAVIAFFPILVNTVVGLRTVEQDRIDLMVALKASRWQVFRYVRLPTALPFIFAGLDVGIVLSVIGAIVGEFVGANAGLGYLLLVYNNDLRIAAMFALLIILAALGIILHGVVQFVQRRVMFWSAPRAGSGGP